MVTLTDIINDLQQIPTNSSKQVQQLSVQLKNKQLTADQYKDLLNDIKNNQLIHDITATLEQQEALQKIIDIAIQIAEQAAAI